MTHYIVAMTHRKRNGDQQAACGEYVRQVEHSPEPSCEACRRYVQSIASDDVEALFGTPDPALQEKAPPDVDVVGEYHRQMRRFER